MSEAGKGSSIRPTLVSKEEFSNNWDKVFGKKEVETSKYDQCEVPCVDCAKHNVDCFKVEFDPKIALVDF